MSGTNSFKSRLVSAQKPQKRRKRKRVSRNRVDLMELRTRSIYTERQRRAPKATWIGAGLFLIAVPGFFVLGCLVGALSVSGWVKILLTVPLAVLGFVLSYIVVALFR